jgi:hypothetical protein
MRTSFFALLVSGILAVASAQTPTDVQPVQELVRTGTLGTCTYQPVARESPFYKKLDEKEVATGSFLAPYSIHGKTGKYVSWFGVVRGINSAPQTGGDVTLLLENKFFDGMTDCHIMLVSHAGGGDFRAMLNIDPATIPALALVRIYGRVVSEKDKIPVISTEYIRIWPWMTFTFTDLGPDDSGNPRWAKYASGKGGRIYNPYPNDSYYRHILGDPAEFGLNLKPE